MTYHVELESGYFSTMMIFISMVLSGVFFALLNL